MADIFICYRRNDSEGYAGRLHDHLVERFGARAVFVDVDNLHPGQDFDQVIQRTLQRSSVVLVVIGRHWMDQRLRNEGDYVRREIISALKGRKRLIPVLVGDAQMPAADKLPPELGPLVGKNAVTLRHATWKSDVARLIASLQRTLARKKATAAKAPRKAGSDKPTGAKKRAAPTPRRTTRTEHGGNETPPRKATPRGGKTADTTTASPPRRRPGSEAEQRRRAEPAADVAQSRGKPPRTRTPADAAPTPPKGQQPRGKKPPVKSTPRTSGGGGGRSGGTGGGKSGAKTPAAGSRRRRKKPVAP